MEESGKRHDASLLIILLYIRPIIYIMPKFVTGTEMADLKTLRIAANAWVQISWCIANRGGKALRVPSR